MISCIEIAVLVESCHEQKGNILVSERFAAGR